MCATSNWTVYTTEDEVHRRASGRRKYNALRQFRADLRLMEIIEWAESIGWNPMTRGFQSRLAERFGVHRSTISRDLARLRERRARDHCCPTCGAFLRVRTRL